MIGRTASKNCVPVFGAGVSLICPVALGADSGSALNEDPVSPGDGVGVLFTSAAGVDETFLFFRGFGVGVGRTKSFLNLSASVSSCSSVARATPAVMAIAIAANKKRRSLLLTRNTSDSAGQLLKHSLVHLNPGFEIFERKVFVWGMRAAIRQR